MKQQNGFSILEFVVSMLLLVIAFAIVFTVFVPVARSAKVESTNIQTQVEGILGLEILRRDVVHAGVGLPWTVTGLNYSETNVTTQNAYNDAPSAAPRPIIAVNGDSSTNPPVAPFTNSDYLVIKSNVVADTIQPGATGTAFVNNPVVDRWTSVYNGGNVRTWGTSDRDPQSSSGDRVLVIQPSGTGGPFQLTTSTVGGSTTFYTTVNATAPQIATAFAPTDPRLVWYAYGISDNTTGNPTMPFNRADYYLSNTSVPKRCAVGTSGNPGTGVLVKRVLKQDGTFADPLPLLDCVADFQIALGVDNLANNLSQRNCLTNPTDGHMNDATLIPPIAPANANEVRTNFKEVRIYILAQEGAADVQYRYPNTSILVGEPSPGDCDPNGSTSCKCTSGTGTNGVTDDQLGRSFDLTTILNYQNYRWRVYKMVIKPEGLTNITPL